jgi:hypothetical protein
VTSGVESVTLQHTGQYVAEYPKLTAMLTNSGRPRFAAVCFATIHNNDGFEDGKSKLSEKL